MTTIKAAAVQISPVLYSREGTLNKVLQTITDLGRQGVQVATFPETVLPYYPYFSFVQRPFEMEKEYLGLLDQSVAVPSPYATHPERFVRKPPRPLPAPQEVWINKPQQTPENKSQ